MLTTESLALDFAFKYLLLEEGEIYTNRPTDAGGPTKYGVTQRMYEEYVGHVVSVNEIKDMTKDTAKKVFKKKFWDELCCDEIDDIGVATCLFSSAALYGVGTVVILAQKAINKLGIKIGVDAIMGVKTLEAINATAQAEFIKTFYALILTRIDTVIASHPEDEEDRAGWTNRANRLLTLIKVTPENQTSN